MLQGPGNQGPGRGPGKAVPQEGQGSAPAPSARAQSIEPASSHREVSPLARAQNSEELLGNLAVETLARIGRMAESRATEYDDLDFHFGKPRKIALTPAIITDLPEVEISLCDYQKEIRRVSTEVAIRTDSGRNKIFSLDSTGVYCPDNRDYARVMLATLEGAVLGAAQRYGQLTEGSFTPAMADGVTRRRNDIPHNAALKDSINMVRARFGALNSARTPALAIEPIQGASASSTIREGYEFTLELQKSFTTAPLVKCRIDALSPVVETEFPGGLRTIHSFETTQAAIYFIVGVGNGAIAAEAAQHYNSPMSRLGRLWRRFIGD